MIGARLKLARAAAGLSLRELEAGLQALVTAQAIGKYERDEMMPSSSVLIALARTLKVTEEYLLNPADIDLVGVEFRKKKLTSVRETAEVQARILSEVERYLEIEQILAVNTPEVFPSKVRSRVTSVEEVDDAAKALRKLWHLGDDAIPNLCEFLEEKGIKICAIALPDNVSGVQATVKSADGAGVPVIVVNASDPGERQRFTVAHELGHLYLDIPKQRDPEPLCHRFAGAFLVPAEMLQKEVGNYRHAISVRELFQLKQLFGVSAQAIAYRCKDLGIINQPTFSGVFKVFGIKKWRRNEPNPLPKERPSRFERLCIRALAEDVISEARASELLRKTVREVVESLDRPPEHGRGDEDERVH
jgi:Zn-dependent peptidase ImmA (M78 family)